jgi:hypothetical protein
LGLQQPAPALIGTANQSQSSSAAGSSLSQTSRTGSQSTSATPTNAILTTQQRLAISKLIKDDPARFGVTEDGRINSYRGPVKNSDYEKALDYMAGMTDTVPRGFKFFERKIRKDAESNKIFLTPTKSQKGTGKKRTIKFARKATIIRTPGLYRIPNSKQQFRPQIWSKL